MDTTQPAVRIQAKCTNERSQEDSVTGMRSRLKVISHAVILHEADGKVWHMKRTLFILHWPIGASLLGSDQNCRVNTAAVCTRQEGCRSESSQRGARTTS